MLTAVPAMEDKKGALRWEFYVTSARDMRSLGEAFGRTMLPHVPATGSVLGINLILHAPAQLLRIGLCSDDISGLGKSTFAKGILNTVSHKSAWESRAHQHVWFSPESGSIRDYDCKIWDTKLPSYRRNDLSQCLLPRLDIAEHPHMDMHDKSFNCLAFFEHAGNNARRVTFEATPELAETPEFRSFLEQAAPLMKKPDPG